MLRRLKKMFDTWACEYTRRTFYTASPNLERRFLDALIQRVQRTPFDPEGVFFAAWPLVAIVVPGGGLVSLPAVPLRARTRLEHPSFFRCGSRFDRTNNLAVDQSANKTVRVSLVIY